MNRLIVLEGLDGAGKSTQVHLLRELFNKHHIRSQYLHFPQTDPPTGLYGQMVANFLKGEYGAVQTVHPYLVSLLYAGDREHAKTRIKEWLDQDFTIILDRYVYSNMAFQGAKLDSLAEKQKLCHWLRYLEFQYNGIPVPGLSVFLHMPFSFISQKLGNNRNGQSRDYLRGKKDIHESNLDLQKKVEQEYLRLVNENDDFYLINCTNANGLPLPPDSIHQKIVDLLQTQAMLPKL